MKKLFKLTQMLSLCTALYLAINSVAAASQDHIIAVVNNHAITAQELQHQKERILASLSAEQRVKVTDQQVLEQYINQLLQVQLATKAGVHIENDEVTRVIKHLAEREDTSVSAYLHSIGLSEKELREQIRQELMVRELQRHELAGSVQVSDREIQDYWKSMRRVHDDMPLEPDEEAKAQLRELIFARKFEQKLSLWIAEQRDHAFIEIYSDSNS